MNEQSSKKILFNKSTLFSLKAELLKKQEEVYEKKQLPQHKIDNYKPPPAKIDDEKKAAKAVKKSFKDGLKAVDTEELEACRKAKLALEKKAELYDHLSDGIGNSQLANHFLVDFNTKKQSDTNKPELSQKASTDKYETNDNDKEDDNEWTEFTDCLGRTRKCLKSDLQLYIKKDKELMKATTRNSQPDVEEPVHRKEEPEEKTEKPILVQTTNDYLQSLREKWEEKERELLGKDNDIHYQDLLFDEARIHGVGYYSFSTDETERRKQMEELLKRRQETLRAQQEAEALRKKRDELMAARVAAARARQRARAGLPPEEPPKENQKDFTACLLEFLTQQKNEADAKANEEARKLKEEQEKERQKLREAYVREWDIGKDGVDGKVKKFKEMTQEEYVEQQRGKRIDEFAPPQFTSNRTSTSTFDNQGKIVSAHKDEPLKPKTWADVRPTATNSQGITDADIPSQEKGLYFSSVKKPEINMKYRNFVKAQHPTPIVNEVEDDSIESYKCDERRHEDNHAEIAPPPTYDYYGPVPKKSKTQKPFNSDIREAFAQGSKSLEAKSSNRQLSQSYDFTFD